MYSLYTPHNAYYDGTAFTNNLVPLWNHVTSTATYDPYTGVTQAGNTFDGGSSFTAISGVSLACLSCHDGTVGPMEYYQPTTLANADPGGTIAIGATRNLGTDLRNDHPVSFDYAVSFTAEGATGLVTTATVQADGLLFGSLVECGSCHDVHNQGEAGAGYLLTFNNTDSALCLKCHVK